MKNNYFLSSLRYSKNKKFDYQVVKDYLQQLLLQIDRKQFYNDNINYEYLIAIDEYYKEEETIQFYLKQIKKIITKNYDMKQKLINKYILINNFHTTN